MAALMRAYTQRANRSEGPLPNRHLDALSRNGAAHRTLGQPPAHLAVGNTQGIRPAHRVVCPNGKEATSHDMGGPARPSVPQVHAAVSRHAHPGNPDESRHAKAAGGANPDLLERSSELPPLRSTYAPHMRGTPRPRAPCGCSALFRHKTVRSPRCSPHLRKPVTGRRSRAAEYTRPSKRPVALSPVNPPGPLGQNATYGLKKMVDPSPADTPIIIPAQHGGPMARKASVSSEPCRRACTGPSKRGEMPCSTACTPGATSSAAR